MQNTRLIQLLTTLSAKEYRELDRFIQSPFFNQREDVVKFFQYLHECMTVHRVIPDKQQAHRFLYQDAAYDDHRVRVVMSLLLKLIEKFLVTQEFLSDDIQVKTRLLKIFRQRQLRKHFESTLREVETLQEKKPDRNADYFEHQFMIRHESYQFKVSRQRIGDLDLQLAIGDLDTAYLSRKLRQVCLALSHQAVYKTEYSLGLVDELLHYIAAKKLLDIPAISIYYHAYHAIINPDHAEAFAIFKQTLLANAPFFPPEEQRDLFLLAVNFCMRSYNEGNPAYLKDLFVLYQEGLEQGYLLSNGQLSRFTFRNIVTLGLILREYHWVEQFINDYQLYLPIDYRSSMHSFCLARLEYSRQNFDIALQLLQHSNYKDLLLNLSAKTVMLKIFYEMDEFDLLDSHLQAMHIFLRRKKIMAYHQENYQNLLRFTKKLLELKPYDEAARIEMRKQIQEIRAVAERAWLLERLAEF